MISTVERLGTVDSTNDVVRARLLDGAAEIHVAVADAQTAGRGREGRRWQAPPGRALLLSAGFRPTGLPPGEAWRLAAVVSLAMADAAEEAAGLRDGAIRLKWPNDLIVWSADGHARKVAGVLGETAALGTDGAIAIVGIGVNADWPAAEFPPDLADGMSSLREAANGRPIDREALLEGFLARLEPRVAALYSGAFDRAGWADRQVPPGQLVLIVQPDGTTERARMTGVDPVTGALLVTDAGAPGAPGAPERSITTGEIRHLRLAAESRV